MLGSFLEHRFVGFGETQFLPGRRPQLDALTLDAEPKQLRKALRQVCPRLPGVYGMIDAEGRLIYVGRSKSLRSRLITYLQSGNADDKGKRIIAMAERIVWEVWPHELTALFRELELIVRWRPRYNVQGQPGRNRQGWMYLTSHPAPKIGLSSEIPKSVSKFFGPIPIGRRTRNAVRRLSHYFGLRDCSLRVPIIFSDQRSLFPLAVEPGCMRAELGTCLTPCAARCTQAEYQSRIEELHAFLQSADRPLLADLHERMQQAANECRFEQAVVLRDDWTEIGWLVGLLDRLNEARRTYTFVYPLQGRQGWVLWLLVRQGKIVGAVRQPRTPEAAHKVLRVLTECRSQDRATLQEIRLLDVSPLLIAWFERNPQEMQRTISWQSAIRTCRRLAAVRGALRVTG